MDLIWTLPILLTVTLAGVVYPLFSRRASRPLPQDLEDNPWLELEQQRDRLLHQLKEWQMEGEEATDAESVSIRAGLEQDLADVLARLDRMAAPPTQETGETKTLSRNPVDMAFGVAGFVLLAVLTGGLYLMLGTPVTESPPVATSDAPSPQAIQEMVTKLAQRLESEPDNISGWLRLARSRAVLGDFSGAVAAYTHVLSRQVDNLEAAVGLASLQVQSDNAEQVKMGASLFTAILKKNPKQPTALWFLGALAARAGDTSRAIELWQRLLPLLPEGSKSQATVKKTLEDLRTQ